MVRNATFRGANLQYVAAPTSLTNLSDVTVSSAANLDRLQYSTSAGKWVDVTALTTPQIEDSSADHQYVFAVSELAADRTITLPLLTGNDTFVFNTFAATLTNKTLTSAVLTTGVSGSAVLDQDDMSSNSATQLATQQSIKAYVDAQVATEDTLAELNDTTISGPASNDVLQHNGSAWVDRTYAEAGIASLTGSETLTNKTLTSPVLNGGALTALTDLDMTSGDKTILDTIGANTLTIGASSTTVTIPGSLTVTGGTTTVSTTNTLIADKLITLNDGGSTSSGTGVGIEVEENSSATGYIKTAADRAGWEIKAPSTAGVLTIDPSANSNTIAFGGSGKTLTISETATIDQDVATTANVTFANLTATGNVSIGNATSDTVTITGTIQGASPLAFEGGTANGYETTLAITDPTADRTWTLPDATDTFVGLATADSLSNKTLASPVITTGDINTPDIDGGTVDAITSLTVAANVDIGSYTLRASGFLADGLTAGQIVYTGTNGVLSAEAALAYNASTNTLTATNIAGTLSTAAQGSVTSLGVLTALTVDSIALNGTTIGHTSDTDLLTLASGIVTVAGEVSMTTLDIGGTNVTSTAAELNILDGVTSTAAELNLVDGSSANSVVNSKAVIYGSSGELAGTLSTVAQGNITSVGTLTDLTVSGTSTTIGTVTSGVWQGTDVGVAYGGTGVSTLTDGGILLGSGASAITAMAVLTDGQMIVGDGTTDPVAESGATLRTSIGVGTGDSVEFAGITGTTIDATTDFTVGGTVITDGVISDDLLQLTLTDASNKWLKIYKSASGATPSANSTLVLEREDYNYLTFITANDAYASIWFADPQDPTAAGFQYYHANDTFTILIGGGQQMVWTTSDVSLESNTLSNVGASGNDWSANTLTLSSDYSGTQEINCTNSGNTSAKHARVNIGVGGTSAGDPYINIADGTNAWKIGGDTSEGRFAMSHNDALGSADFFRCSTSRVIILDNDHGVNFDYVCGTCGRHEAEGFECCGIVEWHDDVMDYRALALNQPGAMDYLTKVGVYEVDGPDSDSPGWFGIRLQPAIQFGWSMAVQNRQRMDAQHDAMDERLKRIEKAVGV